MLQRNSVGSRLLLTALAAALALSMAACSTAPGGESQSPESPPASDSQSPSSSEPEPESKPEETLTAQGTVADATMNTLTITTADGKTLSFSLSDDTDRTKADGILLGDTVLVTYTGEPGTDTLKVSAVGFTDAEDFEPLPAPGIVDMLARQAGTLINAATILAVAILLIWFGLKPALRSIAGRSEERATEPLLVAGGDTLALPAGGDAPDLAIDDEPSLIEDLTAKMARTPQKRLEQMIDFD